MEEYLMIMIIVEMPNEDNKILECLNKKMHSYQNNLEN